MGNNSKVEGVAQSGNNVDLAASMHICMYIHTYVHTYNTFIQLSELVSWLECGPKTFPCLAVEWLMGWLPADENGPINPTQKPFGHLGKQWEERQGPGPAGGMFFPAL